jgi:hypothetical protein
MLIQDSPDATELGAMPGPEPAPAGVDTGMADLPFAAIYRRFLFAGFDAAQAGNLSARIAGLGPVRGGWRAHEIEALLFLRHLVDDGRVGP